MNTVTANLADLRNEIAPCKPVIIAVTKYFGAEKLVEAYEAGLRNFAENRVADALEKFGNLPEEIKQNSTFHLIGHLQTNKVKKAVGHFDLIQSVDSLKLAELVSNEAQKQGIVQKVLLQVNNANEENKSGFEKGVLKEVFGEIISLKGIKVEGLMNIAPITDESTLDFLFEDIKNFKEELEKDFSYPMKELSMGMSGDYKTALRHGATMIRLGRKLFM
ncbi:TPA: YggS family pyridoxal phosphate-dependent enzyme [Candidatus Spyradomonas excrementavium]|nr:YggS family pyridoxal phosphate-dependent enzyme [Candidatus Spyradomonas excrementavium]